MFQFLKGLLPARKPKLVKDTCLKHSEIDFIVHQKTASLDQQDHVENCSKCYGRLYSRIAAIRGRPHGLVFH